MSILYTGRAVEFNIQEGDTIGSGAREYEIYNNLVPTIYLGISKDFRINNRLSTGIAVFRNYGLQAIYRTEAKFTDADTFTHNLTTMNGTTTQVLINLKYRIK